MADPNSIRAQSVVLSKSPIGIHGNNEGDDVLEELPQEVEPLPKIDINALKNEILTDGMQAATDGDAETLQELVFKFGQVSVPNDSLINMYNTLGYTMLHYAVMYKRMDCIKTLIELGADIERPTNVENRDTPLLLATRYFNSCPSSYGEEERIAIEKSKIEIVKFLISQGCKVNSVNKANESPIILATIMQNLEVIQELMKKPELNVNTRGLKGQTPLHIVASTNNHEIAQLLLRHGADVHLKDTSGSTPLHIACYHGSFNIVELIFKERPESQDTLLTQKDRAGNISLMIAKKSPNSSAEIINFLISQTVDLQYTNELGETLLHMFGPTDNAESTMIITNRDIHLLNCRNIYRQTPLHCAAMKGHKESLLVFIRNGADISIRDNDEMTPLMLAIKAGNIEIISVMLDLGCDIHSEAKHEKSLIVWAIENEYTALLKALIERGDEAAKQPVDEEENTFLHVAARSGALLSIQVLMGSTVGLNLAHSENIYQQTALHIAAQHGKLQCLKELLDHDSVITKTDGDGNNALHIACIHGQLQIVQFLLQQGLSAELSNGYLGTPLSCAAYYGHGHIVRFLLSRDVSCDGSYAELKVSPLLLATQQGHVKVVKILLDHPRIDVTLTNEVGYNALAEAIVKGHSDIALEIINSDHWDMAMRMCNANNITPMRLLIEFMPELAGIVMDKCITYNEQDDNGTPYITQITYNYEFIDDFGEPKLGKLDNFLLNKVLRHKSEEQQQTDIPLIMINNLEENGIDHETSHMSASSITPLKRQSLAPLAQNSNENLNLSLSHITPLKRQSLVSSAQRSSVSSTQQFSVSSGKLLPSVIPSTKYWGPKAYDKDNHTMSLMVEHERINLLEHPLVVELLNHKWNKIAMPSICLQLIFYFVFLGFLTPYVLLIPNPRGEICARNFTDDDDDEVDCLDFSHADRHFLSIATIILVVLSCINLTLEGLQIFNRKLKYFYEWQNYVEISLSSLTISFVLITRFNNHSCFCPNASQWQLGSVVIFLAWIDLILLMNSVPFVAISINMLISITKSFLKLAFLPMLLIVSFGIPFFLLFHQPGVDDAFRTVRGTFVKSVMMTIGELDYNDNFIEREVFYPFLYYFWILFVIVMAVLFNNLLVGLAVGDTGEELQKANLTKLELQVELITELEERLPSVRLYFYKKFHMLKKHCNRIVPLVFLQTSNFDTKAKAVKGSKENNTNVIEEYQKENPIEELKEKLTEQENEIRLLKELVVKGFKGIETMPLQSEKSVSPTATTAVEDETDKIKVTVDDASNDTENHTGPELPLPVPNLF